MPTNALTTFKGTIGNYFTPRLGLASAFTHKLIGFTQRAHDVKMTSYDDMTSFLHQMHFWYFQLIRLKEVSDPHLSIATCVTSARQTKISSIQNRKW